MNHLYLSVIGFFLYTSLGAQLNYNLSYKDSSHPGIYIQITTAEPISGDIHFVMPRSIPGAYSILKYDSFIEKLEGLGIDGKIYPFIKDNDNAPRWSNEKKDVAISSIRYYVNLGKMEKSLSSPGDASIIRKNFAGLLNYSVFGWIEGMEMQKIRCTVETFPDWPIFSTNVPSAVMQKRRLEFETENYYSLADGQLFMGPSFQVKAFKAIVPLFVVSYAEGKTEYLDDYGWQEVTSMEILYDYFGQLPFNHYSLMLRSAIPPDPSQKGGLAMEHLKSSTFFNDTSFIRKGAFTPQQRLNSLPTYLHHMSHAFIPLHSYGDAYRPYVLEIPPIINNIWFNEGFMWFIVYDTLKSERLMKNFKNSVYNTSPIIKKMSLQQLSQAASMQYGDDFRLGRSVYSRGALMANEMNEYVKKETGGKKSIKDIYRYLYNWSLQNKRPFLQEEFPGLLEAATGVNVKLIYDKWQLPVD